MYNKRVLKKDYDYTIEYGKADKNKIEVMLTGKNDFTDTVTKKVKVN